MFSRRGAPQRRPGLGAFRRSPGSRRRHHRRARERGDRSHRSQRRGEDDALQRHHRSAATRPAAPSCSTARTSPVKPHQRARLGIARTFQRLETFGTLTRPRERAGRGGDAPGLVTRDVRRPGELADELLERVGITSRRRRTRRPAAHRHARLVELARALATKPRVLLLDEPSSGLNEAETDDARRRCCTSSRRRARRSCSSSTTWPRHGRVRPHPRARLRSDHRRGTPDRDPGEPAVHAAYLGEGDEADEVPESSRRCRRGAGPRPRCGRRPSHQRRDAVDGVETSPTDTRRRRPPTAPRSSCATCARLRPHRRAARRRPRDPAGHGVRAARPERRGQVDDAEGRERPAQPDGGEVYYLGGQINGTVVRRGSRARACARSPRAAASSRTSPCSRTCACRRTRGDVALDRSRTGVHAVPPARGAPQADRRHAVRWRAADARHGARARRPNPRCCCSTSCRWGSRR